MQRSRSLTQKPGRLFTKPSSMASVHSWQSLFLFMSTSTSSPLRSAKTVSLTAGNFLTRSLAFCAVQKAKRAISRVREGEGMLGKSPLVAVASFLTWYLEKEERQESLRMKPLPPRFSHRLIVTGVINAFVLLHEARAWDKCFLA